MSSPFTNTHIHVFNTRCAPDKFLRIISKDFVRKNPETIKAVIDSKAGRWTITKLYKFSGNKKTKAMQELGKYLAFLDVAGSATQQKIFEKALQVGLSFDPAVRIVGLTLNMDLMDNHPDSSHINFETQLEEVKGIKRYYPKNFFPFLSLDPRHKKGADLKTFCLPYIETGTMADNGKWYPYFSGLKLYPALGYFPFDPGLADMYQYAEENGLPIMTHCTRVGSQYIGDQIENLVPRNPEMILPNAAVNPVGYANALTAQQNIISRIASYYNAGLVKNSKIGDNDAACDLFGNPENYVPLLEAFPKLKICFAHMGGSSEIVDDGTADAITKKVRELEFNVSWFDRIKNMMKAYPNMYTDISYTLADLGKEAMRNKILAMMNELDNNGQALGNRVLFGTDFFMTEQENSESELFRLAKVNLADWFDRITRDNPSKYLGIV